jgi:hypothetical protein
MKLELIKETVELQQLTLKEWKSKKELHEKYVDILNKLEDMQVMVEDEIKRIINVY